MPRKFSEQEKEWIRNKLMETARQLFAAVGLKKTSLEDLTKSARISQGAFYIFFRSKEELYYEVLLEEEKVIREQLSSYMEGDALLMKEGVRRFLLQAFRLISENPIIRHMYIEGEYAQLVRKLPKELLDRDRKQDQDALLPIIQKWQEAGILAEARPEHITGVIRAMVLLSLHKKDIGETEYEGTIHLLIDLISAGMFNLNGEEERRSG